MSEPVGPAVAREVLRVRLREFRDKKGLSTRQVATSLEWSLSKLTRIEKGDVTVQPLEVRALLTLYGVTDDSEVETLTGLARSSRTRQWYSRHRLAGDYYKFVGLENEASRINIWQVLSIPGLLQTADYARVVAAGSVRKSPKDEEVEARVEVRLDRQRAFQKRLHGPNSPRIIAAIDESALRRPLGGAQVFGAQLDHLLHLGKDSAAYTIAVVPLGLTHHPGMTGTFELLEFDGPGPDVLFVEAAADTDDLRTDPDTTKVYRTVMAELLDVSLTGDAALDLIRGIRANLQA